MTPLGKDVLAFEALRDAVAAAPSAASADQRSLVWADAAHTVGVARDAEGRLEVFLVGEPLVALDLVVVENLVHQTWQTSGGTPLAANRLVLPVAGDFDGLAAFICTELLQNGFADERDAAFRRSEPVISLALRRATLGNQALVGLAGELFVLASLVAAMPARASQVVDGWFGSGPSSRDLQLGPIGIEIKTTTGADSIHHIQGFHQVERGHSVDDAPETHLFLLSIGIAWLPAGATSGRSVPELVDAILASLPGVDARTTFVARVRQYGGDSALGYDHEVHRQHPRYSRSFQPTFERLYDTDDERVRVLRRADVEHAVHVNGDSVAFRVALPRSVRGDVNPVNGMKNVVARLITLLP